MFKYSDWSVDATMILSRRELAAVLSDLAKRSVRLRQARLNRVIFRLACCCGPRASEIAGLQLADVHVSETRPHLVVRPKNGKGEKGRAVPLWWDAGTCGPSGLEDGTSRTDDELARSVPTVSVNCDGGRRPSASLKEVASRAEVSGERLSASGLELLRNEPIGMTVAVNSENRGFPLAVNQGIQAARGQQILLLNNDTIVTSIWNTVVGQSTTKAFLHTEHGAIEWALHSPFFLVAAGIAARLTWKTHNIVPTRYRVLYGLFAAAGILVALEEISYGQKLFHWSSPEWFAEHNSKSAQENANCKLQNLN